MAGETSRHSLGLALDLGTTSLAGVLLGADGKRLAEAQLPNPQKSYGADVLRRLEAARDGRGAELQQALLAGIDSLCTQLCDLAGVARDRIAAAAAAANPAITTLLRNQPVEPILFPPYRPAACAAVDFDLVAAGLKSLPALYLFPLVNGFVGGDLVAFLYSQPPPTQPTLYIDVGTNAEMALYDGERWQVTSVAAGPAFEGEGIASGMQYAPGAVTAVRVDGERLGLEVAGGGTPVGICGSGLSSAIAVALEVGLIDRQGTICDPDRVASGLSRYLQPDADGFALQLYRDAARKIVIRQQDVRNFQLAKAAVKAGVDCLLERAGLNVDQIDRVVLTGAFGFSLSSAALKKVAMLPANMVDKVLFRPGGALAGVSRCLAEPDGRQQVEALVEQLRPYPLSGTPAFEKAFIRAIDF